MNPKRHAAIHLHAKMTPIPKARMTHKSKWTRRAKRTLEYQQTLAWLLVSQNRTATTLRGPITLSATFGRTDRRRVDLKNLIAAVEDALEYSGLIQDDRQIVEYQHCKVIHGSREPFIEMKATEVTA